jgi:transposase InsO family protein
LDRALLRGKPTIVNTDQGSHFTAQAFTSRLETIGVQISMDGRGRVFDTIVSARFWRSVNDAHLDRHDSQPVPAVVAGVRGYMAARSCGPYHRPRTTAASRTLEPNQVLILLAARPTGAQWLCPPL